MYSQIIKEGFLNLETVPEAKTLTNRSTFHKRLTLMILHTKALTVAAATAPAGPSQSLQPQGRHCSSVQAESWRRGRASITCGRSSCIMAVSFTIASQWQVQPVNGFEHPDQGLVVPLVWWDSERVERARGSKNLPEAPTPQNPKRSRTRSPARTSSEATSLQLRPAPGASAAVEGFSEGWFGGFVFGGVPVPSP